MTPQLFILSSVCITIVMHGAKCVDVITSDGTVRGTTLNVVNVAVDAFLGIPYGKPRTGPTKFMHPEPVDRWDEVKVTTSFGNQCPQADAVGFDLNNKAANFWYSSEPKSDDCLNLNVWRPAYASDKLPVLVWIYGGAFISGTASLRVYNGARFAALGNMIVVSMNYRVGLNGFLYFGNKTAPGNQGLMDQLLALKWVNKNINAFNGDPKRVTIFGESAGAGSVSLHVLSPMSRPYFQQAILNSGSFFASWAVVDQKTALWRSLKVTAYQSDTTNRTNILKDLGITVSDASSFLSVPIGPVADNYFIPTDNIDDLLGNKISMSADGNNGNPLRIFLGSNKNEGTYFLLYAFGLAEANGGVVLPTKLESINQVDHIYRALSIKQLTNKKLVEKAAKLYDLEPGVPKAPDNKWTQIWKKIDALTGDSYFRCPIIKFADSLSSKVSGIYMHSFEHHTTGLPIPDWTGAMHGYELDYVFGMPHDQIFTNKFYNYTSEEIKFSSDIMTMWINFIKNGNPSTDKIQWPEYNSNTREYVVLKPGNIFVDRNLRKIYCDLWNHAGSRVSPWTFQITGLILLCHFLIKLFSDI